MNISKDDFAFAASAQISKLMGDFEKGPLLKYIPCNFNDADKIAEALGIVHAELVLIHPFREGNGRIARVLSVLMALQAGLPVLDFGGIKGEKRKEYFEAIQASMGHNYKPITKIFRSIIRRTLKAQKQ